MVRGILNKFSAYLVEHGLPTDVTRIGPRELRLYLAYLRHQHRPFQDNPRVPSAKENMSSVSVRSYAAAIKAFSAGLHRERYLASVKQTLFRYLHQVRPKPASPKADFVFLTRDGYPLAPSGVQTMLKRYGARARIEGMRVSPHTLRHSFATSYLLNGGDRISLQKILGHSTSDMVLRYINLTSDDIKAQHRKFSPAALTPMAITTAMLTTLESSRTFRKVSSSQT